MWMASLTPLQVLLPEQLQAIDPHGKIVALAFVSAFGAIASVLATPVAGALSDRTTQRLRIGRMHGRRHRWTLVMAVLAAICLACWRPADRVLGVAVVWVLFSAFQNGEFASLSAAVPDHVPVNQRATVAGWVGMPQALGLVIGTILVVRSPSQAGPPAATWRWPCSWCVLTLPFVLFTRTIRSRSPPGRPLSLRTLLSSYWLSPRRYPDFGWAWLTRFLASLAIAMGTLVPALLPAGRCTTSTRDQGLLVLIVIYTVFVVITAIVGGVVSDRIGKRKMIVTARGTLMGVAALLLTFVETWPAAMVAAVLFGAASAPTWPSTRR